MNDLETLYREHASAIFRFACGLSGDWAWAQDITSETFVRVLTRAPRIETRTARGYLLAVARNVFLQARRRRVRETPLPDDVLDSVRDPGDHLDFRARLEPVLQALRVLPEGEKAALLLRVDHEMSYEEIAAALGISVVAAKVRVHRARLRLANATALQEEK
jgi:RNA polymerase sigma-70 factor, ECF subfamily